METSTDTGTALRERGAVEKKLSAPIRGNKPDDPNTVKETTEGFSEEATPHEQPGKKGGKCIPLREQHLFMASSVNWGPVFPLVSLSSDDGRKNEAIILRIKPCCLRRSESPGERLSPGGLATPSLALAFSRGPHAVERPARCACAVRAGAGADGG